MAPATVISVRDAAAIHFQSIARILDEGLYSPILSNGCTIVIVTLPHKHAIGVTDLFVEHLLKDLPRYMQTISHGQWDFVRQKSQKTNRIIAYRTNAFASAEQAIQYALDDDMDMKPIEFSASTSGADDCAWS
jgi:hypothetical protein